MTPLELPDPIKSFFAADSVGPDAVARCFTPQGIVQDEGQAHRGIDAIRTWKAAASEKYRYTSEPIGVDSKEGVHTVTSRVTGNFPGSPVDLTYRFRLERGLIASLEIAA